MNANRFLNSNLFWLKICLAGLVILPPCLAVAFAEEGAEEPAGAPEDEAPSAVTEAVPASTVSAKPTQATVEILVMEYTTETLFDLGTSLVYTRREEGSTGPGIISLADFAFPSLDTSGLGLAAFLDKISIAEGEFEILLQALEQDENIEILSRPRLLLEKVTDKEEALQAIAQKPEEAEAEVALLRSVVQTVEKVPYETTKVVGTTTVQITEFKDTGVTLEATLLDIIDDEYVELQLRVAVAAEGPRLTVALADQPEGKRSVLEVPEFFSRSLTTQVIVRDRQVRVLGALLSTEKVTSERKLPILGEIPVLKYLLGSRSERERYRELIFFVKPVIHRGGYVRPPDFLEGEWNTR